MHAAISFYAENTSFSLKRKKLISAWLQEIITSENKKTNNISIIFCDDAYLLDINKRFLKHHTFTDTITFDYSEGNEISGDIFISLERVKENAAKYGNAFIDELYRVICHGMLHLVGYTDKSTSERHDMTTKEDHYLDVLRKLFDVPRETNG